MTNPNTCVTCLVGPINVGAPCCRTANIVFSRSVIFLNQASLPPFSAYMTQEIPHAKVRVRLKFIRLVAVNLGWRRWQFLSGELMAALPVLGQLFTGRSHAPPLLRCPFTQTTINRRRARTGRSV